MPQTKPPYVLYFRVPSVWKWTTEHHETEAQARARIATFTEHRWMLLKRGQTIDLSPQK